MIKTYSFTLPTRHKLCAAITFNYRYSASYSYEPTQDELKADAKHAFEQSPHSFNHEIALTK
jgi:hypothetical protein